MLTNGYGCGKLMKLSVRQRCTLKNEQCEFLKVYRKDTRTITLRVFYKQKIRKEHLADEKSARMSKVYESLMALI